MAVRKKVSKQTVNYRPTSGIRKCGTCAMYRPRTETCDLVLGAVDREYVCNRWTPKR